MSRTVHTLRSIDRREDRRQAAAARDARDLQDGREALTSWWQDDPTPSGEDS